MLEHDFDVQPIADGKIHRFRGPDDKHRNGWYVFHGDYGAFGNWKSGLCERWSKRSQLSPDERCAIQKKIRSSKRRYLRETRARHEKAATEAANLWIDAMPCIGHTYLSKKGVLSHGLKVKGIHLLVPMYDGQLWSLQKIAPDGSKRFLTGGKVSACYFPIGKPKERLWLAEGYATAATLQELTGDAVACCFNAGNLAKVAKSLRSKLPGVRIVIGADNDEAGLSNASRAAAIVGGVYVYPEFDPGDDGSDWNDFAATYGKRFTREAIRGYG